MLTADLVRARRQKGELVVSPLSGNARERASELAEAYIAIANDHVGRTREELRQAWNAVPLAARDKKLADGLLKLVEDACELSPESEQDPIELRRELFSAATAARQSGSGEGFSRQAVVSAIAARFSMTPEELERALYADLRSAHTLQSVENIDAPRLLDRYDAAQIQAVLLRAVKITARVRCREPWAYRALFRSLKFRRLLYRIEPQVTGGYTIEIDGPYSLFDSVTKYGLQLALVLPSLMSADELDLTADIRWGKSRERLTYRLSHRGHARRDGAVDDPLAHLADDVRALVESFGELGSNWNVTPSADVIDLPGVGLCVPDLLFEHAKKGTVYLEVLGFWSRDAVWKRVELARSGLPEKVLFAVSSRLRVSEAVLDDVEDAALCVYKGTLSARTVLRHLDDLADRAKTHPKRRPKKA